MCSLNLFKKTLDHGEQNLAANEDTTGPAEGLLAEGLSAEGMPAEGLPVEGKPVESLPAEDTTGPPAEDTTGLPAEVSSYVAYSRKKYSRVTGTHGNAISVP